MLLVDWGKLGDLITQSHWMDLWRISEQFSWEGVDYPPLIFFLFLFILEGAVLRWRRDHLLCMATPGKYTNVVGEMEVRELRGYEKNGCDYLHKSSAVNSCYWMTKLILLCYWLVAMWFFLLQSCSLRHTRFSLQQRIWFYWASIIRFRAYLASSHVSENSCHLESSGVGSFDENNNAKFLEQGSDDQLVRLVSRGETFWRQHHSLGEKPEWWNTIWLSNVLVL